MTLTICAFKWGTRYTLRHVSALQIGLARHLTIPYRFALISDDPDDEAFCVRAGIRFIPLWDEMRGVKNCGVRLHAFHPRMEGLIGKRFAWIDLDVVLTGNVDHIFSRTEALVGLKTPAPPMVLNGSFLMMDAGAYPHIWYEWTPYMYEQVGQYWIDAGCAGGGASDEGWIGFALHTTTTSRQDPGPPYGLVGGEPGVDGIYYFKRHLLNAPGLAGRIPLPRNACMVVMNGRRFDPALPEWQTRCPWLITHWTPGF